MNFDYFTTRAMELLGVRGLSLATARLFGVPHPPSVKVVVKSSDSANAISEDLSWTKEQFVAFRQDARYSLIANAIRGSMTVPLVYATAELRAGWIPIFTALVLGLHVLIVLVDGYRLALARELEPFALPNTVQEPRPHRSPAITFKTSGYFKPRPFENQMLFRALGVEWFRKVVVWFVETTKLSQEDRKRGEEVHYVESASRSELVQFEAATRTAEAIHLICAIWNVPAATVLILAGSPWAISAVLMIGLDCYLVLLQRYHRARVWALILSLVERLGIERSGVSDRAKAKSGNPDTDPSATQPGTVK
jgi:hypothetical protein